MKFTDVIARILKANRINCVFGLQGGAVAHIFDSLERFDICVNYTHHESAAALAAAAYAKATEHIGCAVVTTGPGCTNAITGLMGAWQDSVPCIFISGQVRSNHTSYGLPVRQVGTQEVNIVDIVRPLCKYSKFINKDDEIEKELKKAIRIAQSDRPGPVWLDIPLELQWSDIEVSNELRLPVNVPIFKKVDYLKYEEAHNLIKNSKKPLLILGYGVLLSKSEDLVKKFIENNDFRSVSSWTAASIFGTQSKHNLGIIGMSGQAGANKAVFEADLLICLGTHLSIPHTTTLTDSYAPNSKKIFVNIDGKQLNNLNIKSDLSILSDIRPFIEFLNKKKYERKNYANIDKFKRLNWKRLSSGNKKFVNSNVFFRRLTRKSSGETAIVVDGGGTALYTGFQSSHIEEGQRIFCSSAISSMGTGLAETLGVFLSGNFKKIITIIGDGSMLMNIQDLLSISHLRIPVIICVINNNGYLAIRHTQTSFLNSRLYGTHPDWKLGVLDFKKAAKAFGVKYLRLSDANFINLTIDKLLETKGPVLCEVITSENQSNLFAQGYKDNGNGTFSPLSLEHMK